MTDELIVEAIRNGGTERDKALKHLFLHEALKNSIFGMLHKFGAQLQDREDIFQEALITFDRNVIERKFAGNSSILTYIVSISKFIWFNLKKKSSKVDYPSDENKKAEIADDANPESLYVQTERMELNENVKKILNQLLDQLDERCRQALRMWSEGQSMANIQKALNFKEQQGASNKTHRCRERLRKMIRKNPGLMNFLKSRI